MTHSILIVIDSLNRGGAERHVSVVFPHLQKKGFNISVFIFSPKSGFSSYLEQKNIKIYTPFLINFWLKLGKFGKLVLLPLAVLQLTVLMILKRFDIVHCYLTKSYILGSMAAILSGRKVRVMSRRSLNDYQSKYPLLSKIEHFLHTKMTKITANSQAVYAQLIEEKIPQAKLKLIHNGINPAAFPISLEPVTRSSLHIPSHALVMIIVANLFPYKGHEDLINALSLIQVQLPQPWRLLCVGRDTGLQKDLQKKAQSLGVENQIIWLGERNDVFDLLKLADINILCSHEEGFSNSLLEAMVVGLPTIATQVGGNQDAITHQVTGLLVSSKNSPQLAQAILELANNPEKRQFLGANAKKVVEEKFNLEKCVDAYKALYEELLRV